MCVHFFFFHNLHMEKCKQMLHCIENETKYDISVNYDI
jgi:hypothetical protein